MSMTNLHFDDSWIQAFRDVFQLCKVTTTEKIIALVEPHSRQENVELTRIALEQLGVSHEAVVVPAADTHLGPIVRSTGASTVLNSQHDAMIRLRDADFIIDLTVEGLMHASQTPELLKSGCRILNISSEHPDTLTRLVPTNADRDAVKQAVKACRSCSTMSVGSDAGTEIVVDMNGAATVGVWGWTDRPGTLAHWPGGLVVSFPTANSVNGRLVMAPGDMNLTFKRYLESTITLTIENDFITNIDGTGADAALMRRYLAGFNDKAAYATSHVGWGMNSRARYEALTMYDKQDTNGTELRALAGNFLYSTGANEFADRFTRGHFDLPILNCTIRLDNSIVVDQGVVVS